MNPMSKKFISFKLDYPVYTLDKRLFLPAGKKFTSEVLDELIATNKDTSYQEFSFLEYGTVYQDIVRLLQKPPYHIIFEELKKAIALSLMKKISFISPILEFLDYLKKYEFYLPAFSCGICHVNNHSSRYAGKIRGLGH